MKESRTISLFAVFFQPTFEWVGKCRLQLREKKTNRLPICFSCSCVKTGFFAANLFVQCTCSLYMLMFIVHCTFYNKQTKSFYETTKEHGYLFNIGYQTCTQHVPDYFLIADFNI